MGIGIGGGIGPIRVGTSVSDDEMAGCLAWLFGVSLIALAIFWPYLLGDWIAGEFGAAEGSPARMVLGWSLEAVYVLAAFWAWWALSSAAEREREAELLEEQQQAIKRTAERLDRTASIAGRILARLETWPHGTDDAGLPAREQLLFKITGVQLIEPRVVTRGAERVPTAVASGDVVVSDRAVRFRSEEKQVEWLIRKIHSRYEGSDRLTFGVANRQTVSGVGGSPLVPAILKGLVLWAEELPSQPVGAIEYFEELEKKCRNDLAELAASR